MLKRLHNYIKMIGLEFKFSLTHHENGTGSTFTVPSLSCYKSKHVVKQKSYDPTTTNDSETIQKFHYQCRRGISTHNNKTDRNWELIEREMKNVHWVRIQLMFQKDFVLSHQSWPTFTKFKTSESHT